MAHDRAVTDQDIQSLVDNEYGWEEAKLMRHAVDADPQLKRRYEELMEQKKLLRRWYGFFCGPVDNGVR